MTECNVCHFDICFLYVSSFFSPLLSSFLLNQYIFKFIYLFIFWLCWVFVAVHGLSLVAASGGYSSLWCVAFSLQWLLLLRSPGSRRPAFGSCGAQAQLLRSMWDLPGLGLKCVSPALAGGFLTTVPPGKSLNQYFLGHHLNFSLDFKNCIILVICLVFAFFITVFILTYHKLLQVKINLILVKWNNFVPIQHYVFFFLYCYCHIYYIYVCHKLNNTVLQFF